MNNYFWGIIDKENCTIATINIMASDYKPLAIFKTKKEAKEILNFNRGSFKNKNVKIEKINIIKFNN